MREQKISKEKNEKVKDLNEIKKGLKKSEKGAITLFVVVSMLFMLIILILSYVRVANKNIAQNKQLRLIQENYRVNDEELRKKYKDSYEKYVENNTYMVAYNKNAQEATGTMRDGKAVFNRNFSPAANKFIREGYVFEEWNTSPNGSGTIWRAGISKKYEEEENMTLYAQWRECEYTIAFDSNGGIGEISSITNVRYSENKILPVNTFTKAGNIFKGWATSKQKADAGTVEYNNNASVSRLTTTDGETVTLYAVWELKDFVFYANGGAFAGGETTNTVKYDTVETEIKYSHTSNIDDTGKQNSNYGNNWTNENITGTDRGDTTKAHVVTIPGASSLKVTVYYNGESASNDWVTVWQGSHPDYTAASNYSSGVTNGVRLGGSQPYGYTVNGNLLTYIGKSEITIQGDTVTFGFKSNGSGCGKGYGYYAIIKGVNASLPIALGEYKEPTRPDYAFTEWNTKADGTGISYSESTIGEAVEEDIYSLYAQWRETTHTIEFNSNGGTFAGGGTTNTVKFDKTGTGLETKYSHTSNIDDTGKQNSNYGNNWTNANITGTDRGDTTKAHVVTIPGASSLKVTVYYNGESTSYDWVTVWEGSHPDYTAASNSSSGVTNGTKLGGGQSESYTVNGNALTNMGRSEFTIQGDTVTFGFRSDNSNCGKGYGYYAIIQNGSMPIVSGEYKEPTIPNYVFDEWNTKADGTGTNYSEADIGIAIENGIDTLYAQWGNAYLLDGQTFNNRVANRAAGASDATIKSITFDYYTNETRAAIAGEINNAIPVDNRGKGSINAYKVLDTSDNLYDVYVLSDYPIYANSNCSSMFYELRGIVNLNLNNFDTSSTTDMRWMFGYCGYNAMTTLDLGDKFDTSNVTTMYCMFRHCGYNAMTTLDLGDKFDTSNVTDMTSMFGYCGRSEMTNLDLGDKFDTSNVTNMYRMFFSCGYWKMTSLDLGDKFDTSNVTDMDSMFQECGYNAMTSLDLGDEFDTSKVTNMYHMFDSCGHTAMTSLDLGDKFDTSSVGSMSAMFSGCGYGAMTSLDLGDKFDTSNVVFMDVMFASCGYTAMTSLNLGDKFDTSNVIYMYHMFYSCGYKSMTSLDLGDKFDTSNVTDMYRMFCECGYTSMTSLDLGDKFDTSKAKDMNQMFNKCGYTAMTSLDLGDKFDMSSVTNMSSMFDSCGYKAMTSLDLGDKFDTSSVTNMSSMFASCGYTAMTSLDLGDKFDTSSVTNMSKMFNKCGSTKLDILDLGDKFNTVKVTNMSEMFRDCKNLKTIYANEDFDLTALTSSTNMFNGSTKLVGGNGTVYNSSNITATYAKIDRTGTPGYFTKNDNIYKVKFYPNNGTNEIKAQIILRDTATALFKNSFTMQGYAFVEWNTEPDGTGTSYSDEQSVTNLAQARQTVNLYAQWIETDEITYKMGTVAKLSTGSNINSKMKSLAGNTSTGTGNADTNITAFKKATALPTEETTVEKVQAADSEYEVTLWFDNGTIYYYTEANGLLLNESSNSMFQNLKGLREIDLYEFDTSIVKNMSNMFNSCQVLPSLDLRSFDTSKVENMSSMFSSCSALKGIDLSSFNVGNVTTMESMFRYDANLVKIDVSSFNTGELKTANFMFGNCTKLTTIYASTDFVTTNITAGNSMFGTSSNIVGGAGTKYNGSNTTHAYAHIDEAGNPGYFTAKANQRITNTGYSFGENKVKYNNRVIRQGTYVEPERRGYTRTSWNTNEDGTGTGLAINVDGSLVNDISEDFTVYPQWTANTYTVHFDANGATGGTMSDQTFTTDVPQNLTTNSFTSDKLFIGWNTKADGTGVFYENNQRVANLAESGTVTLYAQWEDVVLIAGETFAKKIANRTDNGQANTDIKSITFDYYTTANRAAIAGEINNAIKVDTRDEGLIKIYRVLDTSDNLYDVYVLSDYRIYTNSNCVQMFRNLRGVVNINFNNFDTSKATNMSSMFNEFGHNSLISLDLSSFNTVNVTNMNNMFMSCGYDKMTTLNLGDNFDTSKVTDMASMFYNCGYSSLTSLDLKNKFNTSKVTTMFQMFRACGRTKMTSLNLGPNFDTSNVNTMQVTFRECGYGSMTELDLGDKFDTSNVTIMWDMFFYCGHEKMTTLNLGDKFDTSKVENMATMFCECGYKEMPSLNLGNKFDTSACKNMHRMFEACGKEKLTSLDLGDKFDTSNVTNMGNMFYGCGRNSMASINLRNKFDTSKVTNMQNMFRDCGYMELQSIDLGSLFNTSSCTNMSYMFNGFGATKLTSLNLGNSFDTSSVETMEAMFYNCGKDQMTTLNLGPNFNTESVTNMFRMFDTCGSAKMTSLDLGSKFDTSNVQNMAYMFSSCGRYLMTTLNLGDKFDTSSATNMSFMFYLCGREKLASIDLGSDFDTSSVNNMSNMFREFGYKEMESLDLGSKFDTSSVQNMERMFDNFGNKKMTSLDLGDKFDTSSVTNMSNMFNNCGYTAMTSLDLGDKFDTSKVTNMNAMFSQCGREKLASIDLGDKFNTSKVTNMNSMFQSHSVLESIFVNSDFDLTALTTSTNMFDGCTTLVGGNGTTYSTAHKTADYAKIDRSGVPGYFTKIETLLSGQSFNAKIKGTAYNSANTDIKSITFGKPSTYSTQISGTTAIPVDVNEEGTINAYKVLDTADNKYDVYVLSDYQIYANSNCASMFENFRGIVNLNLNNFDTSSTTDMRLMFEYCGYNAMTALDLGDKFDTSNVTNMGSMFYNCGYTEMTSLDLGDKFDTSSVTAMSYMFDCCGYTEMTSLDLGDKFDTSNVTNMGSMFSQCGYTAMTSLDLGDKFDTSSVTSMSYMFSYCGYRAMTSLDLGDKFDTSSVTNMSNMFSNCGYIAMASLDLEDKFDTSSVTNMSCMFYRCGYIAMTSLDLGDKFDTSSVTNMSSMFDSCGYTAMTSLDLEDKFDTSNVTNMSSMFTNSMMTSLSLGDNFDTSNVTNMSRMFQNCGAMTNLDLGDKFDTSKVTNMDWMFSHCGYGTMTNLDLGDKFDTSSVTSMEHMFYYCGYRTMTSLDLGDKFDTSSVTNMNYMFSGCFQLARIYTNTDFDLTASPTSTNMFDGCTNLVGGNGTVYNSSNIDATYAKIDRAGVPGYFTDRSNL